MDNDTVAATAITMNKKHTKLFWEFVRAFAGMYFVEEA